jgi:hypothetical protein
MVNLGYNVQAIEWLDRAIVVDPERCNVVHSDKVMVFEAMNRVEDARRL